MQNFIIDKHKYIFTPLDLERYFGVNYETAKKFILRNVNKKIYTKIKRGLYFDNNFSPREFEIANKLYSPSYVSFEYALMFYSIIPETVYPVISATSKTTREFTVANIDYRYYHLKKQGFTGYLKKNIDGQMIYLAEPEKALIDYLYFVDLGRKALYDRIDVSKINYQKMMEFAKLFKRSSLEKLTKKIYDRAKRTKEIIY